MQKEFQLRQETELQETMMRILTSLPSNLLYTKAEKNPILPTCVNQEDEKINEMKLEKLKAKTETKRQLRERQMELEQEREEMELRRQNEDIYIKVAKITRTRRRNTRATA